MRRYIYEVGGNAVGMVLDSIAKVVNRTSVGQARDRLMIEISSDKELTEIDRSMT